MVIRFIQAMPIARLTIIIEEFKRYLKRLRKTALNLIVTRQFGFVFHTPNPVPFSQVAD
jgi:hypothetical protein